MNKFIKRLNKFDKRLTIGSAFAVYLLVGGAVGYAMSASRQAGELVAAGMSAVGAPQTQVLGERVAPNYVNPFDGVDARAVVFPVAQLQECRNWEECQVLCSLPAHFQACAAWERSQE